MTTKKRRPDPAPPSDSAQAFDARVSRDPAPVTVADGDRSTSDEAMTVLRNEGVDAWRTWCADHADKPAHTAKKPNTSGEPSKEEE